MPCSKSTRLERNADCGRTSSMARSLVRLVPVPSFGHQDELKAIRQTISNSCRVMRRQRRRDRERWNRLGDFKHVRCLMVTPMRGPRRSLVPMARSTISYLFDDGRGFTSDTDASFMRANPAHLMQRRRLVLRAAVVAPFSWGSVLRGQPGVAPRRHRAFETDGGWISGRSPGS